MRTIAFCGAQPATSLPVARRSALQERLAVNSQVVLTIDRLGSFPGEIRWQNENYVGICFLEEASTIEERLRRATPASGEVTGHLDGRR